VEREGMDAMKHRLPLCQQYRPDRKPRAV
jgi:hypothetical protein